MTFLLFAPASTKWLGWRKDRKSRRDRLGRFCDIYCAVILGYSLALRVTFCGAVVLIVMDQQTFVKRGWSYKMRITACVYINTWRVCQTRVHKSLIGILARHSFSLFLTGIRLSPKQARQVNKGYLITSNTMDDYRNSPTIKFCADLFPAHRCPSAIKFKVRLGCASVTWSNVLLISKAYFPVNKMNWM